MSNDGWADYLAAAQHLDLLRRSLGEAGADPATDTLPAELVRLRGRVAAQRQELLAQGATEVSLTPSSVELQEAATEVGTEPTQALLAVRRAESALTSAGQLIPANPTPTPASSRRPWARNLLVYGPFALVTVLVELVLYAASGPPLSRFAVGWGLGMPLLAYGLGWLVIGLVFPAAASGRVNRSAGIGAVVCATPLLFLLAAVI